FLATGLVALLFQPLRERLQAGVNRLMFGERDDPVAVLGSLSRRLEAAADPEAILPGIVDTVGQALKLPFVAIEVNNGQTTKVVAEFGDESESSECLPLIHQSKTVGQLLFARRSPNESFSEAEYKLLRNIARQTGAAVHAVKLTADLRRSRQQLVTAREEERRRLRRDLHDGLGPVLASQGLKMAAASKLLDTDPQKARQMLENLAAQNEATVAEIRRLVYNLRPAALDELGLVGAVRDYTVELNGDLGHANRLQVNVQEPENGLPSLPAAIEVAAFRIATESLTNVSRHSQARRCLVSFRIDSNQAGQTLRLEIGDDGLGLPQECKPSVGLSSMRERAEEVGGSFQIESTPHQGTRVIAHLPLPE
ncbi:MAG: GAF domain-containing sensor histidine kinase, partial [Anaerolineales bacterium]|nr:GAF domain-containing sensor histidine kinase [Anaerolineales bacterium]